MYTLTEAARGFAKMDLTPDDQLPALEKALRNITQRHYLPPTDQNGRVFLYSIASVVALRSLHLAGMFGLDRWMTEEYARWLQGAGQRRRDVGGGEIGLSICEEAVDRVRAGEDFQFHALLLANDTCRFLADWEADTARGSRVERARELIDRPREIGRYVVQAAHQIRLVISNFEGLN